MIPVSEFNILTLPLQTNLFDTLMQSVDLEVIAKGRIGNHLVKAGDKGVPIVRTTTAYAMPAHYFSGVHDRIIDEIHAVLISGGQQEISQLGFNNALIEVYDRNYVKMNYHSDQNLDLDPDSYIGLFSCYEHPDALSEKQLRKLYIKEKDSGEEAVIPLTHNSFVLFSVKTNDAYMHKIVLDAVPQKLSEADNKWLGITFRTSKTYIQFKDHIPYFSNGKVLELANEEQKAAFFKLRGEENRSVHFAYPELYYTLNPADILLPVNS